jgi:cytochrome P450
MTTFDIDLLSPEALQNPHPIFSEIRQDHPVFYSNRHHAWIISRYDDVSELFFHPAISSDRVRPMIGKSSTSSTQSDSVLKLIGDWMVTTDPPAHSRLRHLVTPAFRPARIAQLVTEIERITDDLIDKFIASGETDLIGHIAFLLPAAVISALLGAPYTDREKFKNWSDELALIAFGAGGDLRDDRYKRALAALDEMSLYFQTLIEKARLEPEDNLISTLVNSAEGNDAPLTDAEIQSMCALILFAGHETTTNLIATAVSTLLQHPDQLEKVIKNPEIMKTAIEEVLRFEGSIKVLHRWVVQDFTLHDNLIKAGQRVFLCLSAANRDPLKFENPESFDVLRHPNPHMAFGKGIHTCIGAQLSRIETKIALEKIFTRLPDLKLVNQNVTWVPILSARGMKELHVTHGGKL